MVAPKKNVSENYEESRNKRMEENKTRMEDLKLTALAISLKLTSTPNNKHPSSFYGLCLKIADEEGEADTSKAAGSVCVRRSNRVAEKPPAIYKEEPIEMLGRRRSYGYKVRDLSNRVYASNEDREYASGRADELHSTLQPGFPSFVKPMLQSHVSGGFWLGLPVHFCKKHLPKRDEIMTLVDEEGDDWKAKYLPGKGLLKIISYLTEMHWFSNSSNRQFLRFYTYTPSLIHDQLITNDSCMTTDHNKSESSRR